MDVQHCIGCVADLNVERPNEDVSAEMDNAMEQFMPPCEEVLDQSGDTRESNEHYSSGIRTHIRWTRNLSRS